MHSAAILSQFHWNICTMTDLLGFAVARPKCRALVAGPWRRPATDGESAAATATKSESFAQDDMTR